MNKLNHEGHDESQYLPRGTPPVNAFRAQHGKVRWEGQSVKAITWMPDILHDKGHIDKCHLDTACSFFTAMVETQKALKIGDIKGMLHDRIDGLSAPAKDIYYNIITQLNRAECNMILWIVCDDRNRGNVPLAVHLIGTIKHALENAQIIIDSLNKNNDNAPSPLPEVRPEFDPV